MANLPSSAKHASVIGYSVVSVNTLANELYIEKEFPEASYTKIYLSEHTAKGAE
jgi:hypothetical protein